MKFAYVKRKDADLFLTNIHQPTLSRIPELYLNRAVAFDAYQNFRRLQRAAGKEHIEMEIKEVEL